MSTNLSPVGGAAAQFLDNNGNPLSGGKIYTYEAGTTTPEPTYTTVIGNVAHSNPIILDSAGRVPGGQIWVNASQDYKFVLTTSADVTIATYDDLMGINGTGLATNAANVAYDPAGLGAVQTNVQAKLRETVSVKDFGAVGDGVTDDTAAIQAAIDAASLIGTSVIFEAGLTYVTSIIAPKSNVVLALNGSTLKLKDSSNDLIIKGDAYPNGRNFAVIGGTIDGNQANNQGNINLSGGSGFVSWSNVTLKDLVIKNVYRSCIILSGTTNNVLIENVSIEDCGVTNAFGRYAYGLEAYAPVTKVKIENFNITNIFGYGIHFYGCADVVANNITMDTFTRALSIGITFTEAKRVKVSNVHVDGAQGDAIEINDSSDLELSNFFVENAGNRSLLIGQNTPPAINERLKITNFNTANTGGTYAVVFSIWKDSIIENSYFDKKPDAVTTTGVSNNIIKNVRFNDTLANCTTSMIYRSRHILENAIFTDYVVRYKNQDVMKVTIPLTVVDIGAVFVVDVNGMLGAKLSIDGSVGGTIKTFSQFTGSTTQGSFQMYAFVIANTGTVANVAAISQLDNATARRFTFAGDAANKQITLTNGSGAQLKFTAEIDFNFMGATA